MFSQLERPRRVVITGMGCVTPIGIGREAFWNALVKGESGVRRIDSFDVSKSPVKIAAQVQDFDWEAQLNPKDRKHVPRTVPLALAAATGSFPGRRTVARRTLAGRTARRLEWCWEPAAAGWHLRNSNTNTGMLVQLTRPVSTRFLRQHTVVYRVSCRWRLDCAVFRTSFRQAAPVRQTPLLTLLNTSRWVART